jgi:tRNA-splicing ligase RtcB (3'-phosphate/5'-hydroxy nucleic acid ligase)
MAESLKQFLGKEAVPIFGWTQGVPVEDQAMQQLKNIASLPFIHKHVAVMPDVHLGKGATIGSVIPTKGAIVPAAVGVDLGCGMIAVRTSIRAEHLPDSLAEIRSAIEKAVPHGRTTVGKHYDPAKDRGLWYNTPEINQIRFKELEGGLKAILEKQNDKLLNRAAAGAEKQLGTLGTGNHFIEVCLDENNDVWVMLHSGSRGIGNRIGTHFIEKAQALVKMWFVHLPDVDLAYLPQGIKEFDEYVEAVEWAQRFAMVNREIMMENALNALRRFFPDLATTEEAVNCHHNYMEMENHYGANVWLTRKGAVRARSGDLGIIPGSMGAKSFIVRGKGNPESFHSCSHGAGRVMSRGEAFKRITLEEHAKATAGVECRKDKEVIDESPAAYKPIEAVMAAQADLIDIVHTLKQCLCVKG